MPSTLTGLLLFVALMLPGFAYLVGKERAGTERRTSVFRETISVLAAGVSADLIVVVVAAPVWSSWIDFGRLATEPRAYWREDPLLLAGWLIGLLMVATLLGSLATWPKVRRLLPREYPHPSAVSSWWMIFEQFDRNGCKYVGGELDNGSYIEGWLASFNTIADDIEDRDLVLEEPIKFRPAGSTSTVPYGAHIACVSARRIVTVFVTYADPHATASTSPVAAEAAAEASAHTEVPDSVST